MWVCSPCPPQRCSHLRGKRRSPGTALPMEDFVLRFGNLRQKDALFILVSARLPVRVSMCLFV